ncbi:chromosomal replication initiator protein DnaA [uncultured Jatrophihabitans sp.]|uniref:chromosomal replication initiator protein DnaA n=1 Tax=uncultured Jatrophihabitans sp. TaxID=1610747 RepID=UPI0035C96BBF
MDDSAELVTVWNRARPRFDDPSIRPQQKAWIGLTRPLGLVEDTALLAAPNDFAKDYLENRLRPLIASVLSEELGREIRVAVTVRPPDLTVAVGDGLDAQQDFLSSEGALSATGLYVVPGERDLDRADGDTDGSPGFDAYQDADAEGRAPLSVAPRPGAYRPKRTDFDHDKDARLNPKYTFDTFVIGSSNRFTHAAAVAVAEAPARAYNPLFIYGDSGLGKTHLLHAIGHYARRLQPGLSTRYVSSEEFTNEFINSVRDDKMQAFQSRYRSVDVLLIDDIQFLERAERTQEEFFHTFNTLHNANKQIVISSDKSPRQLNSLEDRLRTRFEWGLISDVQAPDLETRIAILRKKAAQEGMSPPPEVLQFIASRIQSNIRELEGALIRVTAFASLNHQTVELGLAEMVLKDLVGDHDAFEINAATIMAVTSEYFAVSIDDLVGSSRSRVLVNARQMAMYLCRELTDLSLPKIGEKFGNRDHTTVMHAERKVRALMTEKMTVYSQITELTNRIKMRSRG